MSASGEEVAVWSVLGIDAHVGPSVAADFLLLFLSKNQRFIFKNRQWLCILMHQQIKRIVVIN